MTADLFPFMTGPVSLIISIVLALITGVFVSFFIGEQVIISGIKREKKIIEKTEEEIRMETDLLNDVKNRLGKIEKDISYIKNKIK